jgi:hypothetical protein
MPTQVLDALTQHEVARLELLNKCLPVSRMRW